MGAPIRYFLYARKSTDDKSRQVRSIEEQLNELRSLVKRDSLTVIDQLIEKQSAKAPGRPVFNEMIARIEAGEADGILAWHADRLSRNSLDGAQIIHLFDRRKLQRLQFFAGFVENTPQGKMLLNAEFGFSKYYVDSLSVNVERGHRDKIARGEYPSLAPLGYFNDSRTKRIVVDRDRAPIVRRAFEMYAGGSATLDSLCHYFAQNGIVTRRTRKSGGGKPLNRSSISKMLGNPIYYGDFAYRDEIYRGVHEPIVTKQLFDAVQSVFAKRFRHELTKDERAPKAFAGLLRCAECGCSVTAEIQKGHIYYRCTKKRKDKRCAQPYVREEDLASEISGILSPYALPDGWGDELLALFETEQAQATSTAAILAAESKAEITRRTARIQRLKEAYLDGTISGDEFRSDKAALMAEIRSHEEKTDALNAGNHGWLEPLHEWILTATNLSEIAEHGSLTAKRALAEKVFGSNLVLDQKKARGKAVNPWSCIPERAGGYTSAHLFDLARTHFRKNHLG